MRACSLLLALLIGAFTSALGQRVVSPPGLQSIPDPSTGPRRTLSGTVVNSVTNEPVRRALVRVNSPITASAFTGPDGRFEIPNVPEGQLFLSAQKPGFLSPGVLPGMLASAPQPFTLGPATSDIVVKMLPEAKVSGRVLNKEGEPIENLNIRLLSQATIEGRRHWQMRAATSTDETGAYVLENLIPGRYVLNTAALLAAASTPEAFAATLYPDAPDLSSAAGFELKAGQELPLDLTLSPSPSFKVSGTVSGTPPFSVMCQDEEGQEVAFATNVDFRTGKFTLGGIPRGSWTLKAFQLGAPQNPAQAIASVEVTSDIEGLMLPLHVPPSIPVHVPDRVTSSALTVRLTASSGNLQPFTFDAAEEPDKTPGFLAVRGVPPGSYKVTARIYDNSACLGSMISGSSNLFRDELSVPADSTPPPIEITLRTDCATVSGTVHSSSGDPVTGMVVVTSDSGAPAEVATGPDGKFSFSKLSPGAYHLYAFDDIADLEYANTEALREYTGQDLTLGPNEKATVQLNLITRAK